MKKSDQLEKMEAGADDAPASLRAKELQQPFLQIALLRDLRDFVAVFCSLEGMQC